MFNKISEHEPITLTDSVSFNCKYIINTLTDKTKKVSRNQIKSVQNSLLPFKSKRTELDKLRLPSHIQYWKVN